jgi:hypothetical protein
VFFKQSADILCLLFTNITRHTQVNKLILIMIHYQKSESAGAGASRTVGSGIGPFLGGSQKQYPNRRKKIAIATPKRSRPITTPMTIPGLDRRKQMLKILQ